jgi:exopolysaccharide biosynthesis polyprenyl glycosylphosphotransferase
MNHSRHLMIFRAYSIADLPALACAWLLAAKISGYVLAGFTLQDMLEMRFSVVNAFGGLLLMGIWLALFRSQGLYFLPRSKSHFAAIRSIGIATGIGTILFAAAGLLFHITLFSPIFLVVFWPTVILFTLLFRQSMRRLLGRLHVGDHNRRNIVILGTNQTAWEYAQRIREDAEPAYQLVGFIDDIVVISDFKGQYLGQFREFSSLLDTHVIDEIVVAMPIRSCSSSIQEVIDQAHERGIAVRFPMSQIFSGMTRNEVWRVRMEASLRSDGNFTHDLLVYSGHEVGIRYLIKRLFDIGASAVVLTLISPIIGLAALAIYATSGKPIFFVQDRYGYNGRVFKLYKLRTMIVQADAMQEELRAQNERDGAAFKLSNDPRVTPLGRFLRKTSIDELPQLFNVILGDMSLVGPRPLPLADYRRMNKTYHRRRLSVLPGITGPWQISGRDSVSFEEWMQMDLDYIDDWRLSTDLKILLLTVPVVLFARGSK